MFHKWLEREQYSALPKKKASDQWSIQRSKQYPKMNEQLQCWCSEPPVLPVGAHCLCLVLDVWEAGRGCYVWLMLTLFPLHAQRGTLDFQRQKPVSSTQTVKRHTLWEKNTLQCNSSSWEEVTGTFEGILWAWLTCELSSELRLMWTGVFTIEDFLKDVWNTAS